MTKAKFKNNTLTLTVNGIEFAIERIDGGFRAVGGNTVLVFNANVKLSFVLERIAEATK